MVLCSCTLVLRLSVDQVHVLYLLLTQSVSIDILVVQILLGLVSLLLLRFRVHHGQVAHLTGLLFPLVERGFDGVTSVVDYSLHLFALQLD